MKNQFIYVAITLALLLTANSCSDNDTFDGTTSINLHQETINVTSTIGSIGGGARATFDSDGLTPIWESTDFIAVQIDNNNINQLKLTSGTGTTQGKFSGYVTAGASPEKMYFYYPETIVKGVDLTTQDASHTKEMIMFASCDYALDPSFIFGNKSSILKFNMDVPKGSGWSSNTELTATVGGVYCKGMLEKDGAWSNLKEDEIKLSNVKVVDEKITGYAVVIPGSQGVKLRILITDNNNGCYLTEPYTKIGAIIPENLVLTIQQPLAKVLVWEPGITKEADVTNYLGEGTDLIILAKEQMTVADFEELRNALFEKEDGTINLTILNQESLPYDNNESSGAFEDITSLKSVFAPHVKSVESSAFLGCDGLVSVNLPLVTTVGSSAFENCSALTSIDLSQVITVGNSAFKKSTALTSVFFPLANSIGNMAFKGCSNLDSLSMPILKTVGEYAFEGCSNLNFVSLPTVETVGEYAFCNCAKLTIVQLLQATNVGNNAFYGCIKQAITLYVSYDATWYGDESDWQNVYKGMIDEGPLVQSK